MTIVVAGRGRPGKGYLSVNSDWNFLAVMQTGPTSTCCRIGGELLNAHSACLHKPVIANCDTNVIILYINTICICICVPEVPIYSTDGVTFYCRKITALFWVITQRVEVAPY